MGLKTYCLWVLAFRITAAVSDIAGYGLFYDPALAVLNLLKGSHKISHISTTEIQHRKKLTSTSLSNSFNHLSIALDIE